MLTMTRYMLIFILVAVSICMLAGQDKYDKVLPNCPMHVIVAVDFSASERAFIDEVQTVLSAITSRFELHPNSMRLGLISFNRGAQLIMPLSGDNDLLRQTIEELRIPLSVFATDIHSGIQMAMKEFQNNSLDQVKKFLILISDGDPHAHSRGFGFEQDLVEVSKIKAGDEENNLDPVHVFSLYSGETLPYKDRWSEEVRLMSIRHMIKLANTWDDFYFFKDYPKLINALEQIGSCL